MYKIFVAFIALMILSGCAKEKDTFLEKFRTLDEIPSSEYLKASGIKFTDTIPLKDIKEVFHVEVNTTDYTSHFSKKKYSYIGKYKLNDEYYVLGYDCYSHPMEETSQVIAIYNTHKKAITSKLIIGSESAVNRSSEYKDGIFYIKSLYVYIPAGREPQPGKDNYERATTIEKYRINDDFIFEKIN